jgi:antitoxin VapB
MIHTNDMYHLKLELQAMAKTAKIFQTGRSQAVRLPKEFRFNGTEVEISRDVKTGAVILFEKPQKADNWERFFKMRDQLGVLEDFELERDGSPAPNDRTGF